MLTGEQCGSLRTIYLFIYLSFNPDSPFESMGGCIFTWNRENKYSLTLLTAKVIHAHVSDLLLFQFVHLFL